MDYKNEETAKQGRTIGLLLSDRTSYPIRLVPRPCRINGVLPYPDAFFPAENDKTYSSVEKDRDDLEIFETSPIPEETRAPRNAFHLLLCTYLFHFPNETLLRPSF